MNDLHTRCGRRLKSWAAFPFAQCSDWWLLAFCQRFVSFGVFSSLLGPCMRLWQAAPIWRIITSARSR
jgi:hypothetical protein